jgi:hypothetical protein
MDYICGVSFALGGVASSFAQKLRRDEQSGSDRKDILRLSRLAVKQNPSSHSVCHPAVRSVLNGWRPRARLLLGVMLLTLGCQYDPHARLYTTEKPQAEDVVGVYTLARQTVTRDGLAVLRGQPCNVDLRPGGEFTATNVPPWLFGSPGTNFFSTLLTGSGKWRIDRVGSIDNGGGSVQTQWGVYLDSPAAKFSPVGLTGQKAPYGLIFTLGDPDSGEAMILERAK